MTIEKQIFQSLLNTLAPALSAKGIVPQFQHYCFQRGRVYTYNDIVAVEADCAFPLEGGLKGDILSRWVSSVKGREIEIEASGKDSVLFKSGRSRIELITMSPDEFLFSRPKELGEDLTLELEDFISAIEAVLPCANAEATNPWQFGVTVHFGPKQIECYATQTFNLARAVIGNSAGAHKGTTLLIPPQFCELLIANRVSLNKISASKEWIIGHFEGVKIYAKLTPNASVDKYHSVCKPETREIIKQRLVPVPKGFAAAIERVMLVLGTEENSMMRLQVKEDMLIVTAEAEDNTSKSKERLKFPGAHKPVVAYVDRGRKYLKPILTKAKSIAIIPENRMLALGGEGVLYLYSVVKGPTNKVD